LTTSDIETVTLRPISDVKTLYVLTSEDPVLEMWGTIIKCIKIKPKSLIFARKSRKSFKKLLQKSEKSNRRIHSQIQDWTITSRDINEFQNHQEKLSKIKNRELLSGVVYFLTIFEHNFFSLNDHETDFSLVYHPPRACTTIPSDKRPPSCGVKENVFKTKNRNVKGKLKITTTSELIQLKQLHFDQFWTSKQKIHLKSKIRTSKSGLRTEFGGPGSEISAKNTFSSFFRRKIKKFTSDFANNDASSTMLGGKFLTHNKQHW
jgi:hypothetical protein